MQKSGVKFRDRAERFPRLFLRIVRSVSSGGPSPRAQEPTSEGTPMAPMAHFTALFAAQLCLDLLRQRIQKRGPGSSQETGFGIPGRRVLSNLRMAIRASLELPIPYSTPTTRNPKLHNNVPK